MLLKEKRLIQKKDFSKIQRFGRRFFEDNLQLQCLENGQGSTRIGFVVGVRFSKKAVERNALKRKLREIFRRELKNIKAGAELVISVRGRAGEKETYEILQKKAGELLRKSNLLIKKS